MIVALYGIFQFFPSSLEQLEKKLSSCSITVTMEAVMLIAALSNKCDTLTCTSMKVNYLEIPLTK